MNAALEFLSSSPARWLELFRLVEQQIADMPPNSWRPLLPNSSPEQQADPDYVSQCLMDAFSEHSHAVFAAVCHRHKHDEWPTLSPPQVYYLRQMHGRLLQFSQGIVLEPKEGAETIFPFPKMTVEGTTQDAHTKDVLFWFLTEWWMEHGLRELVYEISHRRNDSPPFEFSKN